MNIGKLALPSVETIEALAVRLARRVFAFGRKISPTCFESKPFYETVTDFVTRKLGPVVSISQFRKPILLAFQVKEKI